jgi:hypothetical protein
MRTTVDIPDPVYKRLKAEAVQRGCTVKELVLRGVRAELGGRKAASERQTITLPIIDSKRPGWLRLTNSQINEILFP